MRERGIAAWNPSLRGALRMPDLYVSLDQLRLNPEKLFLYRH